MRDIKYAEAIYEGFDQALQNLEDVFIIGQGLWSPWYVGSTMTDIETKYAIRQLNNICHEIESWVHADRKNAFEPEWMRPSQIDL